MSAEVQGQIRTLLAFVGGIAVQKGWIDNETMLLGVGAVTTVIVAVWSWISKRK